MDEVMFLQEGSTLVSSTRLELQGQTFAVRNIGSVKMTQTPRKWLLGAFLAVIGLMTLAAAQWAPAAGFLAVAGFLLWRGSPKFNLVLVTGGGEVTGLTSTDASAVEKIRDAVAKAISAR